MDSLASETLWQRRLCGVLMSVFADLALLLASMGVYGVTNYPVSLRTREIGIWMALGAPRQAVLAQVAGHGMRLALTGVIIGLVPAFGSGHRLCHCWLR